MTTHTPELDALQDAVFDAFAAYWRDRESEQAEQLWRPTARLKSS